MLPQQNRAESDGGARGKPPDRELFRQKKSAKQCREHDRRFTQREGRISLDMGQWKHGAIS